MDDGIGPIEIEFIINNPELLTAAGQAEATMQGVTDAVIVQTQKASAAMVVMQSSTIEGMKIQAAQLEALKGLTPDVTKIAAYNQQIEKLQAKIQSMSNIAKTGFDELGNALPVEQTSKFQAAIGRATDLSTIGGRAVQMFSRQIIGLGVAFLSAEIGAKAIQGLIAWIQNLDIFTGRLDQAKQNMLALNDVMASADKDSGKQISSLKELYAAATDVTNSTNNRIAAAQELKKEYPAAFSNASLLAIMNGEESKSYQQLTLDIVANAKAKAAATKIAELAGKQLDNQFQIDKNNSAKASEIARVKGPATELIAGGGGVTGTEGTSVQLSEQDQKDRIKSNTDQANFVPTTNNKVLQGQIDFLTKYVGGNSKIADALNAGNKLIQEPLKNFDTIVANASDNGDLENLKTALQAKLEALAPSDPQIKTYEDKIRQVEEIQKRYTPKTTDGQSAQAAGQTLLASQTSELEKIDALKDKYAAKNETRDEQAADAIKASFTQQLNAINTLNVKYDNYVAKYGAAAAKAAGLQRIDPNVLSGTETDALAGLAGEQSVEQTKNQIATQKQIFTDYEAFKLKAGTDAANKLYSAQLGGFNSYVDYLKSLQPTVEDLNSPDKYVKAAASKLSDFLKTETQTANDASLKQQQKHLEDLITQNESYVQQREALIKKSIEDSTALTKEGDTEGAAQNDKALQDKLSQLDEARVKDLSQYKDLFSGNATAESAQQDIDFLDKFLLTALQKGTLTTKAFNDLTKAINDAQTALKNEASAKEFADIGTAFSQLGPDIAKVNSNFGALVTDAGSAFTSLSKITTVKNQLDEINEASKSGALSIAQEQQQTQDLISEYTIAAQGVLSIISSITSASAIRKQEATDYYNSVIAYQNDYNLALIQQQQVQYQTDGNVFSTNYAEQLSDAAASYQKATTSYQAALAQLSQGEAIVGQKNVVNGKTVLSDAASGAATGAAIASIAGPLTALGGAVVGGIVGALSGIFGGKTKENMLAPLLQQYPLLIDASGKFNESMAKTLISTNQVTDATKVLLQNTINYYDEAQSSITQIDSALSSLAQNLGSSLDNALVTAFENGTSAADAFGDAVSNVIGNIVQQFLFEGIFGGEFDKLQAKLNATVLAGGSTADINAGVTADFVQFFKTAGPLVQEFNAGLTSAQQAAASQGINILGPTSSTSTGVSSTTLTGQVGGMTVNEATELDGSINGLRLAVLEMTSDFGNYGKTMQDQLSEIRNQTLIQMQIAANTLRIADTSDMYLPFLKSIDGNTSSSSLTNVLRAAGTV